ncbi:hypothetical protein JRO89_XSUnG0047100 [Xanthoceras sorbifolium]|uniref:Bet v I/Major latex protein domain-containing protein n=1 Tax=Xanthoceras sorbifolium TaxID=99658 RepID=A0ABQ8GZY3_9ROSI|nr:hypothetical protein JRO89_XSUnG0047100 [Xanthoceras sorbifolium]
MALSGRLEADIEIKAPAEKYYNIFKAQCHHVPNIASTNVQGVDLHEGDWETHGSVKLWKYTIVEIKSPADKFYKVFSCEADSIPNLSSDNLHAVELHEGDWDAHGAGDLMKHFKSYKVIIHVVPKSSEGSLVRWIWEYEKLQEDGPTPSKYVDAVTKLTKNIDANLLKAEQK